MLRDGRQVLVFVDHIKAICNLRNSAAGAVAAGSCVELDSNYHFEVRESVEEIEKLLEVKDEQTI